MKCGPVVLALCVAVGGLLGAVLTPAPPVKCDCPPASPSLDITASQIYEKGYDDGFDVAAKICRSFVESLRGVPTPPPSKFPLPDTRENGV
jgi:hypothetical protein